MPTELGTVNRCCKLFLTIRLTFEIDATLAGISCCEIRRIRVIHVTSLNSSHWVYE